MPKYEQVKPEKGSVAPRVPRIQLVTALHLSNAAAIATTSMEALLGPRRKGRDSTAALAANLATMTSVCNESTRILRRNSARFANSINAEQSLGSTVTASAGGNTIGKPPPVSHVSFPVKLDATMTVESLCAQGLLLAGAHARDSGVVFNPPSPRPDDYALRLCAGEAATVFLSDPFVPQANDGDVLRRQIAAAVGEKSLSPAGPLMYVAMVPSREFVARHAVELGESLKRDSHLHYYSESIDRAKSLAEVSIKKAESARVIRVRHEVMIADVEAALFDALAVVNAAGYAVQAVRDKLQAAEADWEVVVGLREKMAGQLSGVKRDFYNNSMNAAKTVELAKRMASN